MFPYVKIVPIGLIFLLSCQQASQNPEKPMEVTFPNDSLDSLSPLQISQEDLYDKVLGMLVGSAIGDAMGAPTEMWSRYQIQLEYGFVDSLDDMVREPSPEGTWAFNLPAGGTTDDTRWKVLLSDFFQQQGSALYQSKGPDPYAFAEFIVGRYQSELDALKTTDSFDPAPIEQQVRRMAWLQEWAVVAKPFAEKDLEGYAYALNRFYGGEMTCAGMLYTPMIGLVHPGEGEQAYKAAYRLSLFDLGYARDISALTASMVAAAMHPEATSEEIMRVLKDADPQHYFRSRLVGRSSYRIYRDALGIVNSAKSLTRNQLGDFHFSLPIDGRDSLYVAQLQRAFELLDDKNQDMPFHAGEIHLINLTALLFGEFDFQRSMEFVINYGRDNDTVGAITGAILGAYWGMSQLPVKQVQTVLNTQKTYLGMDLESHAESLVELMISSKIVSPSFTTNHE